MNLSEALKAHLDESAKDGSRLAILFAQIALFTATIFAQKTKLYAEHDRTGFKTGLSYQIIAIAVSNSWRLRKLGHIHGERDYWVNSISNLICSILAIVLEKFYEKSLCSLGFALSIKVLLLILLVIIEPSTDLGLSGFLVGVIVSVAYHLFGLKFQFWIVVAICFLPLVFRCWLEKNWLGKGPAPSPHTGGRNQICKSEIIEKLTVGGFHLFWVYNLFRSNCRKIKGPPKSICCNSSSIIMGMPASLLIFILWFCVALIPRLYSLIQTGPEVLSGREGGREDPEADPEALSGREERREDPEALSGWEGRRDPEADPKALSGREETTDPEALSRTEENWRIEAVAGAIRLGEGPAHSIVPGAGDIGPGAGGVNSGAASGSVNSCAASGGIWSFGGNRGPGAGGVNSGGIWSFGGNRGPGAGGVNSGAASGSLNLFGGDMNIPIPTPTGNTNRGPGAGGVNSGDVAGSINSYGGDRGVRPTADSSAINIGRGLRKRAQLGKEDRWADEAR